MHPILELHGDLDLRIPMYLRKIEPGHTYVKKLPKKADRKWTTTQVKKTGGFNPELHCGVIKDGTTTVFQLVSISSDNYSLITMF